MSAAVLSRPHIMPPHTRSGWLSHWRRLSRCRSQFGSSHMPASTSSCKVSAGHPLRVTVGSRTRLCGWVRWGDGALQ
eukprot:357491-Chlamydomonas_euryale.AAC.2